MTNKIIRLRHIAIIVSVIILAIGMAVGTICHFLSNGFFNYGDEFAQYKSVEITTSVPEDLHGDIVQQIASDAVAPYGAYEISFSQGSSYTPNTVVCKFYMSASDEDIAKAVAAVQACFEENNFNDATVASYVNELPPEGRSQLMFLSIALASAVAFQAIYFAFRFKPGMALSALATQLVAVGLYASLLAITRCPVGLEAMAFALLTAVVTMLCNGIFFDKVKKSFKDEANAKADRLDLIADGAKATSKLNIAICAFIAVAVVIFGIFAIIALPTVSTLAPVAACLLSVISCVYAFGVVSPASYALINKIDRRKK